LVPGERERLSPATVQTRKRPLLRRFRANEYCNRAPKRIISRGQGRGRFERSAPAFHPAIKELAGDECNKTGILFLRAAHRSRKKRDCFSELPAGAWSPQAVGHTIAGSTWHHCRLNCTRPVTEGCPLRAACQASNCYFAKPLLTQRTKKRTRYTRPQPKGTGTNATTAAPIHSPECASAR
jgi:hypothetical protein